MGDGFGAEVINIKGSSACSAACADAPHADNKMADLLEVNNRKMISSMSLLKPILKKLCRSEGAFFATEESRTVGVETLRYRSGRHS